MGKKKSKPRRDEYEEDDDNDTMAIVPVRAPDTSLEQLYLEDDVASEPVIVALVPPDLSRCQCEWRDTEVETFGPKPIVRCDQEPSVIAFQRRSRDEDQPTGSISLCANHKTMIEHMYPGQCYFRQITSEKKIGDVA